MRVGLTGENPLESALIASGLVPIPMLEAYAPVYARALVLATKLGIFDALRDDARSADAVASSVGTDPGATEKLLNLLVTMRYLRHGGDGYSLTRHVRRWRPSSPGKGGQQGAFFDLYFSLTSQSGLWTFDEMRSWQQAAGLTPRKSISLVPGGGFVLQIAERTSA